MKIVSFIKCLVRTQELTQQELEFFIFRITISLVNCKEYVEDSFSGRTLQDIDFASRDTDKKLFHWQTKIMQLEKILALWSWERGQRLSKQLEANTALLKTLALKTTTSQATNNLEAQSIFQSQFPRTPNKSYPGPEDYEFTDQKSDPSKVDSPIKMAPNAVQHSSLKRYGDGDTKNYEQLQSLKTPSLGKMGSFGTNPFQSDINDKYFGVGELLQMSQLKNKIQNPAVREAELRPKILSKFKNLDKENQQAILKKMEEEMSKKFKEDLKSIRSPMLFKKYQLLESGVKSSKFVSGREGTELYESELVTRANTKYRKEGNQLPVVVETVRKDVRKQSLFQQPGDQYLNIQGMESTRGWR